MMGPCAKKRVVCTLVMSDGRRFVGTNDCRNPQTSCPRLPGEGYRKCRDICDQPAHAEDAAVRAMHDAGAIEPEVAYIEGIQKICGDCLRRMSLAFVREVRMGPPPA